MIPILVLLWIACELLVYRKYSKEDKLRLVEQKLDKE
jgi:hypothetical protein